MLFISSHSKSNSLLRCEMQEQVSGTPGNESLSFVEVTSAILAPRWKLLVAASIRSVPAFLKSSKDIIVWHAQWLAARKAKYPRVPPVGHANVH